MNSVAPVEDAPPSVDEPAARAAPLSLRDVSWLWTATTPQGRVCRALFAVLWLSFAYFGSTPTWNPNTRFNLVRAIVEEHTLVIDRYHQNTGDKALYDGHYYSDKAPGLALLAVPVYVVIDLVRSLDRYTYRSASEEWVPGALYLTSIFTVSLLSALACVVLWRLWWRAGVQPRWALVLTLLYALGTPAFAYSTLFFGHQAAAAVLVLALGMVLLEWPRQSRLRWLLVGTAGGWAVLVEYPSLLALIAVGVLALVRAPRAQRPAAIGWMVLGGLPWALVLAGYNGLAFGAPWRIGYATLVESEFSAGMHEGFFGVGVPTLEALWGITFGGKRGLFAVSPLCALAVIGLVMSIVRRDRMREVAIACAAISVAFIWLNGSYAFWHGGASFGPRHLVPALPFLAWGLVPFARHPAGRAALIGVGSFSVLVALAAVTVGADLPEYGNALLDHIWPAVRDGRVPLEAGAYNIGTRAGLPGMWSLLPLLGFWSFALPLLFSLARDVPHVSPP